MATVNDKAITEGRIKTGKDRYVLVVRQQQQRHRQPRHSGDVHDRSRKASDKDEG